jgi:hypothetical protein
VGPAIKDAYKFGDPGGPTRSSDDSVARVFRLGNRTGITNVLVHGARVFTAAGGHVFELDLERPQPNTLADIILPEAPQQEVRMAVRGEVLWVAVHGAVHALDMTRGLKTIGRRLKLPGRNDQTSILVHKERVWVAADGALFEVDPTSQEASEPVVLADSGEVRLAASGDILFAGHNGKVYAIDASLGRTPRRIETIDLPGRQGVTNVLKLGRKVYAGADGRVFAIDPAALEVTDSNELTGLGSGEVTLTGNAATLFVGLDGQVSALNLLDDLKVLYTIPLEGRRGETSVALGDRGLFAGSLGRSYQLSPFAEQVFVTSTLPGVEQRPVRLGLRGDRYFAGIDGRVFELYLA